MSIDCLEVLEKVTYKNTGLAVITGISPFFLEYAKPKAMTQFSLITSGHCSSKASLLNINDYYKGERKHQKLISPCHFKRERDLHQCYSLRRYFKLLLVLRAEKTSLPVLTATTASSHSQR